MNLLMSMVAIPDFREEKQLSAELHQELLLSNHWFSDADFSSILANNSDSTQSGKFHSFSAWPVIKSARGAVSQEYVPLGKVVRLRAISRNSFKARMFR